ncbi:uncharacterized protein LOC134237373 [Saccostrea cucullata]|uniref:uncharacterized protein LOC134237373 n=1 Tax=Saccostrea cuccullata TaxID=36930 RepID=UPI002ED24AA0
MATPQRRGCSKLPKHYYVNVDRYKHQTEDNLKSKGICNKMSKAAKIFITTVTITGLALMLAYLANDQRKIYDLNKNVQAQTSSLWSEQSKDSDDFNNTLIKLTEDQREEDEIMSIFINDTLMQLEKISNVTNISLSLSKESQISFRVMTDMVEDLSSQTNSSMNEIGNMVDALSNEIQISSSNITNTMETLSNDTKTSSIELKNMLKEQSNQSNTFLEDKMKELLKDLKDELTALIESRIGGGCINNSLNVTTGECQESCLRVPDGNYQSCDTCHGYVTCANNYYFTMNCPETLKWDDNKKSCERTSETCNRDDFT